MTNTKDQRPHPISAAEWREIAAVREVRDAWGMQASDGAEYLKDFAYGVRFAFTSGSPGYCGDLFILQGDALTDVPPLVLTRDEGTNALHVVRGS